MKPTRFARLAALLLVIGAGLMAADGSRAQDDSSPAPASGGTLRDRIEALREARAAGGGAAPSLTASSDVTSKITKPGDYAFIFDHDGISRAYRVHVPPKYAGAPTPLLVSLHGGGANMDYQASDQKYGQITKSDQAGFIVVFPNGYSRFPGGKLATFNGGNCCGPARDKDVDDVGFIRDMIGHLEQQLSIDRNKIFATGMSNGGIMAQRLACEMSDTFKAIAPVAGTDNTKACSPKNPISVLQIHAKDDDHLPFNGGQGAKSLGAAVTNFTSVPESISRWVKRDACSATPKRVLEKPGAYCDAYTPCAGHAEVELCVTDTGGHSWPGTTNSRSSEPPSQAINANDVMWDFFMRQ